MRWPLFAIAALVLVGHSLAFDFVTDDAYISFVYARNLAEHGELVFNLGDYVEGYTNFLWTVILAGGIKLGVAPELLSRILGTVCALGTLFVVFRMTERALGRKTPWSTVPVFLLAASSGFACWTSGGLETQLFTLLVTIALDGVSAAAANPRAIIRAGVALALAAMTRPEGVLVAAVFGAAHFVTLVARARAGHLSIRHELVAIAVFLGVWGPWFYWRYTYYGHLFPNTYYVKASGTWRDPRFAKEMLDNGLYYIWVWSRQTKLVLVAPLAILGLIVGTPRTPRFALAIALTLLLGVYLVYTVSVGGDFMGLHRFIMPLFVVAAIAVTLGLEWLARIIPANVPQFQAVLALVLVLAFGITQAKLTRDSLNPNNLAADRGIDTPAFLIVYTEDRAEIGKAMAECFRPDDFSIVGGAGAQPYFARMRGIDVFGLVSDRIAHEEPRIRPRAGHTKFASDALLAAYDPTFVFSCYQIHGKVEKPPHLGCGYFWQQRGYEQVTVHVPALRQQGQYYTFLAKKARDFQCPRRVF